MFDLNDIVNRHDMSSLDLPFTTEEIDEVINHLPNDKVPGLDGFNGKFMKKYWNIIKLQFYDLLQKFYEGDINLESLNTAFIMLIPKRPNPETASYYRPISLVSMALTLITKIIANRVQKVIIPILHQNQYGFIRNKTIQDCLSWGFEYLHICHKSKKEIVILKLDFEKAFDTVEYFSILSMLRHLGFSEKFISWIYNILTTVSTSVILNGVLEKNIICKRGVRQGDLLSPLLFVATAKLLKIIINYSWHEGVINLPINNSYG
jgi:hypothetical protein